jgi:hypothetical protein
MFTKVAMDLIAQEKEASLSRVLEFNNPSQVSPSPSSPHAHASRVCV